jgi:hypothetical protein
MLCVHIWNYKGEIKLAILKVILHHMFSTSSTYFVDHQTTVLTKVNSEA